MSLQSNLLDDQQLAIQYRDEYDDDYTGAGDGARCRGGHANMRVVWRNATVGNGVYNLCLECNGLYGLDWEGGAHYSAGELVHLSNAAMPTTGAAFYRGWPEWWLEDNGLTHDDVGTGGV